MKKASLILASVTLYSSIWALSLEDVKVNLKRTLNSQKSQDSLWIEVDQKVNVGTHSQTQHLKMVSLGVNLMRMEFDSPLGKQVMVKNESGFWSKDPKTGKLLQLPNMASSPSANLAQSFESLWGNGDFNSPLKEGALYKLESKSGLGLGNLQKRTLWYNSSTQRIDQFQDELNQNGQVVVALTKIEYCSVKCSIANAPKKLTITTTTNGQNIVVEMTFTQYQKVNSLPSTFFDLK